MPACIRYHQMDKGPMGWTWSLENITKKVYYKDSVDTNSKFKLFI